MNIGILESFIVIFFFFHIWCWCIFYICDLWIR